MTFPEQFSFSFLDKLRATYGSPFYLYDQSRLEEAAQATLAFPNAFGLTVRYAVKANPNRAILQLFHKAGIHFDASSVFEVERILQAGIPASSISLSSQEFTAEDVRILETGITINACSLNQIQLLGEFRPGSEIGVRFNPGKGSGGNNKTNTGGPESSFGIWHEYADAVKALAGRYGLKIVKLHSHIGSGSDPELWKEISNSNLDLVHQFADVHTVDLGGGFKVGRVEGEITTDLQAIGAPMADTFRTFAEQTSRKLHLEIEPGTWLVANAGFLVSTVQDLVDTGARGYTFIKLDTGMTDILRPSLYGAQHAMMVYSSAPTRLSKKDYVVVGHCCESGDLLTPAPGQPDVLSVRSFPDASIGDIFVIAGAGAYCSALCGMNYNSFPAVPEIMLEAAGTRVIRKRQTLDQVLENEYF